MTPDVDAAREALWVAVRGYGDAVRDVVEDRATFVAIDHAAAVVQTREDALIAAIRAEAAGLDVTAGQLAEWLDSSEGRVNDIFALWVQGKRSGRWVAEQLIDERHLARLAEAER